MSAQLLTRSYSIGSVNAEFAQHSTSLYEKAADWLASYISLPQLNAVFSFFAALCAVWIMQDVLHSEAFKARSTLRRHVQRFALGLLALALFSNGITPFVITDQPWFTDVMVSFSILILLASFMALS